jgi:peptide chain release factor 2
MRAEAQDHIDKIGAALALLRRFLDWDRAVRRLDELNAKVEDPTLWNDAKAAQEVMRERRRLDEAITATRAIETECADTAELIELGEEEGDEAWSIRGRRGLAALAGAPRRTRSRRCSRAKPTPTTPISKSTPAPAAPRARTGPNMLQRMYTRWAERANSRSS